MPAVSDSSIPESALLRRYIGEERFADCYSVSIASTVTLEMFIVAFYTSRLFWLERLILRFLAGRPSTEDDVRNLATARASRFAAWKVEARTQNEILLADDTGRTRSWLMVSDGSTPDQSATTLFFGSALIPRVNAKTGERRMGPLFSPLLGLHKT